MAFVDPVPCPRCQSEQTVRTGMAITRAIYFCFACGRSFEIKVPPETAGT